MKRLLKLPVLLGVGVAALSLGGVAVAAASSASGTSTRPATQVSSDSTGAPETDSADVSEAGTANDVAEANVDDAVQNDVADQTGDHHDETAPLSGASATASTPEANEAGNHEHKD
jgi:hypothetical protein